MDFLSVSPGLLNAIQKVNSLVKVKVFIDFTGENVFEEIPANLINAVSGLDRLKGDTGYAIANTCSIQLDNSLKCFSKNNFTLYDPATLSFNGMPKTDGKGNLRPGRTVKVSITVGEGNEYIDRFTGVVDNDGFKEIIRSGNRNTVRIKCVDLAKQLLDAPAANVIFTNMKVSDPSDIPSSLVHQILFHYGFSEADIIAQPISVQIPFVSITESPWAELSKLAEAFLATLTIILVDGEKRIFFGDSLYGDGYIESTESQFDFDNSIIKEIENPDDFKNIKNIIKLSFEKATALDNQILWAFAENYNEQTGKCSFPIPPGDTAHDITNPDVEYAAEYSIATQGEEFKVLYADNITYEIESTGGDLDVEIFDDQKYPDKTVVRLANNTASTIYLNRFVIKGDPMVNDKSFEHIEAQQESINRHGKKEWSVNNKYFTDATILNEKQYIHWACYQKEFKSVPRQLFKYRTNFPLIHAQVGALVSIDENKQGSGINHLCLLQSINWRIQEGHASFTFQAKEVMSNFQPSSNGKSVVVSSVSTGGKSQQLEALSVPLLTKEQAHIGFADSTLGVVNNPNDLPNGGKIAVEDIRVYSSSDHISIRPPLNKQLTNFLRFEVQVAMDTTRTGGEYIWCAIDNTGSGIGAVDDWTSFDTPAIVHLRVPIDRNPQGVPIASGWHYRIRIVSYPGTDSIHKGPWSDPTPLCFVYPLPGTDIEHRTITAESLSRITDPGGAAVTPDHLRADTLAVLAVNANQNILIGDLGFMGGNFNFAGYDPATYQFTGTEKMLYMDRDEVTFIKRNLDNTAFMDVFKIGGEKEAFEFFEAGHMIGYQIGGVFEKSITFGKDGYINFSTGEPFLSLEGRFVGFANAVTQQMAGYMNLVVPYFEWRGSMLVEDDLTVLGDITSFGQISGVTDLALNNISFLTSNLTLSDAVNSALHIDTGNGTLTIGPQDTEWAHFSTDRGKFHFSDGVAITGDLWKYVSGATNGKDGWLLTNYNNSDEYAVFKHAQWSGISNYAFMAYKGGNVYINSDPAGATSRVFIRGFNKNIACFFYETSSSDPKINLYDYYGGISCIYVKQAEVEVSGKRWVFLSGIESYYGGTAPSLGAGGIAVHSNSMIYWRHGSGWSREDSMDYGW